jgi:superfamily II DNA or RNA helicase
MERNSTDFPLALLAELNKELAHWNPSGFLKKHQFLPLQYVMKHPKLRGLLVCHGMGYGKTILAAAIAWYLKQQFPNYKVIIIATNTLEENFRLNIRKLLKASKIPQDEIDSFISGYKFVPLNSGVMFKKLNIAGKPDEQQQFEAQLAAFQEVMSDPDFLEDSIVIVDEAHHLANSIVNGSNNGLRFYETVMKTTRIKFFPLTGTPIIKNPFEMVTYFNMLGTQPGSPPLLPETLYDFNNMFVGPDRSPKNADILTNRIIGLTTYYGPLYEDGQPAGFPHLEPIEVRRIPMSSYQWSAYALARSHEKDVTAMGYLRKKASKEKFGRVDVTSTYRVASRQICNYAFPEHAIREESVPGLGGVPRTQLVNDPKLLRSDDVTRDGLARHSTKMLAILDTISEAIARGERKILLYSSFVQSGINVMAKVLDVAGWKRWEPDMSTDGIGYDSKDTSILHYTCITGEITVEDRDAIRDKFNEGPWISLILVSGTGTEGLNLLRGRLVLVMEPWWYYERTNQVIHRFYRYGSHTGMPIDESRVRVVVFLSIVPDGAQSDLKDQSGESLVKQPTSDEFLWTESLAGKESNDKFMHLIVESSIDCAAHSPFLPETVRRRIKCKMCAPTHALLFNENIMDDFKYPNPCKSVTETSLKAKELLLEDGTKYYYTFTREPLNTRIYMYDPRVSGYVIMSADHPQYAMLHEKIMKFEIPDVEITMED